MEQGRISGLDSLRGIAAVIVVFGHIFSLLFARHFPFALEEDYTPLQFLINGRLSVILFFVLSGFVLTFSIASARRKYTFRTFITKRIFRIYVPYIIAMAGSWALFLQVSSGAHYTPLWNVWTAPPNVQAVFGMIAMRGIQGDEALDGPAWSLFVEMQISLLFPFLVLLMKRYNVWVLAASLAASAVAGVLFKHMGEPDVYRVAATLPGRAVLTLYYVQYFAIGCFIAINRDAITTWVRKLPRYAHIIAATALILLPYKFYGTHLRVADMVYAAMSIIAIVYCIAFTKVSKALSVGVLQWLGDISYSLYLIHLPILMAMVFVLGHYVQLDVIALLALPLIFVAAHGFHHFVEVPALTLGRRLAGEGKTRTA